MFNDRYGLTQAVIEGRKTMTRRIMNPQPMDCSAIHRNYWDADWSDKPMSLVVDKDTAGIYCEYCGNGVIWYEGVCPYKAKFKVGEIVAVAQSYKDSGVNPNEIEISIYSPGYGNKMYVRADIMPHQIRITGIKCERLQDISDEECLKEGINASNSHEIGYGIPWVYEFAGSKMVYYTPREAFASLIDKVSGRGTWKSNPWVVAYEFKLVE